MATKRTTSVGNFNRNPALNTSFLMSIPGVHELNYGVQNVELPGLTMAGVETPYKNNQTSSPSNRIDYDILNLTFIVDEDYVNFDALRLWMHRITHTDNVNSNELKNVTLHITNSNKNSILGVVFHKAYPTMLSAIPLETGTSDTQPALCTASFRYQFYDFIRENT